MLGSKGLGLNPMAPPVTWLGGVPAATSALHTQVPLCAASDHQHPCTRAISAPCPLQSDRWHGQCVTVSVLG
jgi:hypothetical protein